MEEIKLDMENLSKEEREQLLKLVEKANTKESKVWKPVLGEAYYVIDRNTTNKKMWGVNNQSIDECRYSLGNCFKAKEEADFALERHKVIVELERFAKENNEELHLGHYWYLMYSNLHKTISTAQIGEWFPQGVLFSSRDIAEKAVKTIGEDRIKKYYFGIKE